jgi:hypothetical protein
MDGLLQMLSPRFHLPLVGLLSASLVACGGGFKSGEESAKSGNLAVRVADARSSGTLLSGAAVTVTAGVTTKSGTTAADGTVTFADLPAGAATLSVTRDQFLPATMSTTVPGAAVGTATVQMQRRSGQIVARALDQFDTPIPDARVQVSVEGQVFDVRTAANGEATLTGVPTGTVPVNVSAAGFQPAPVQSVVVAESPAASMTVNLDRLTQAAGGYVTARPTPSPDGGQTLQFRVTIVVIDENAVALENLAAASFTLLPCADATASVVDCVRSPTDPAFDSAYSVTSPGAEAFLKVAGMPSVPYAAAIALDQSGSIPTSDPTDARIFASKVFFGQVGAGDRVVLAAFATGGAIPTSPVTTYGSFTSNGVGYFDELDQLSTQEGGGTPLYTALDQLLQYTSDNAPSGIPGLRKAVVLFTDGMDTGCADQAACRATSIALSQSLGVDIFTIGLTGAVDALALSELADGGNGTFMYADNAQQLIPIYGSLGRLLSRSLTTYQSSWTIQAGSAGVFVPGRSVLGKMRVATGTNTIELPFVVRIQ